MGDFIKQHRGALVTLALFLASTVGYPVAVDQGWFRYNPFFLPVVLEISGILVVLYLLHTETVDACAKGFVRKRGRTTGMLTIILLFAIGGAVFGWGYYEMLRLSKDHIAGLLHSDHSTAVNAPTQQPQSIAVTAIPTTTKPKSSPSRLTGLDPIASLSQLGWAVKRDSGKLSFEVMAKPLPPVVQSAEFFRGIHEPFRLNLQQVPSIDGLELMSGISSFQELNLSASDLTSISQLSGFKSLRKLEISQVPLNTHADIDSAPLAGLTNLTSLVLNGSRISDLSPATRMPGLERLIVENTLIRDLSPVRSLKALKVLDVRESRIVDLSPASELSHLEELTIDANQVASLTTLSRLPNLHKLTVIGQVPVDLSPIGNLAHLTSLFIWGPPLVKLAFLAKLQDLNNLQISGFGAPFGPRSQVSGSEFLCAGGNLTTLTIGALQIPSLAFAPQCKQLTELNLRDIPLTSLNDLTAMQNLKKVSLMDVPIVEISPLLALPNLETLSLIRVPARADIIALLERKGVNVTNP